MVGYSHMADIRTTVDQDDAVFAELPIRAAIIDEARNMKLLGRIRLQIDFNGVGIVYFFQAMAGVRAGRADNNRKGSVDQVI